MSRLPAVDVLERVAGVGVVAAIGCACLLLAGVHAPVQAALFVVVAVAGGLELVARALRRGVLRVPVLALPLLTGIALTAFSLCPLPHAVRALVSAESTDRLDRLRPLLDVDAAALIRPVLSFDPPESALALVRLLSALVVMVVVADRARHRDGRALLWRALLVSAFVVGVTTIIASAIGVDRVGDVAGLPVNGNHRARVLGALGLLCLGRAFTLRPRVEAAWFAVGGALCALLVVVTGSRGGLVALVVGASALGVVLQRHGESTGRSLRGAITAATIAVVVVGAAAFVVVGERRLWGMAQQTVEHPAGLKTFLWEPSLRVAVAEPLVGVGNNGFGVAFPAVLAPGELDATLTYTHAENAILQTLADHGLVGGGLVLFAALAALVAVLRALRTPAELAATPALVFLLVGDVVDFALETWAGVGLAAVALGLTAGRLAQHREPIAALRPALASAALVVVLVVGGIAAAVGVAEWRPRLDRALAATPLDARATSVQRALARHPSDATYATLLAIDARRRHQPAEALRWANRALVVWPAFREAHLESARALAVGGRLPQAMLEYREAARGSLDGALLAEVAARTPDVALRRTALPSPETASALALVCDVVLAEKRRTEGRACYAAVVERADATPAHLRRALTLALDDEDATTATTLLTRLVPAGSAPDGDDAALAARTRAMVDGDVAALDATTPWLATARAPQPLLEWRLKTQRAVGRLDDAVATLERLLPLSRGVAQRQRQEMQLVDLLVKQGAEARALAQLERTLSRSPRDAAVLAQKALVEVALDRIDDATATLARLRAVAPGDARIDTIAKRLQRSAPP